MKLNFKPTKIPVYEIYDAAGINYPARVGTKESEVHYKVRKNNVTFRVKYEFEYFKELSDGENKVVTNTFEQYRDETLSKRVVYNLYIEYSKEIILKETVSSFEEGFEKANKWAEEHLDDADYINECLWKIYEKRAQEQLEDESVTTMEKAKTIEFPMYSKYSGQLIYDVMQKDLDHCIAYYVGNLENPPFKFIELGVERLSYKASSERTKSYNCIKYLLETMHPDIANDFVSYFNDISEEDTEKIVFSSGKYSGKSVKEVYEENPGYLEWYIGNIKKSIYNIRFINAIKVFVK